MKRVIRKSVKFDCYKNVDKQAVNLSGSIRKIQVFTNSSLDLLPIEVRYLVFFLRRRMGSLRCVHSFSLVSRHPAGHSAPNRRASVNDIESPLQQPFKGVVAA